MALCVSSFFPSFSVGEVIGLPLSSLVIILEGDVAGGAVDVLARPVHVRALQQLLVFPLVHYNAILKRLGSL